MEDAALTALGAIGISLALVHMIARRFRVPPVLMFLVFGVIAGPSALHLVDPGELEEGFEIALEVLVALIVFEGAFSIDVDYLRRVGRVVRNLLTLGLGLTFALAAALSWAFGVLEPRTALLFGALVTVTGPTVITPLVRSIRLNDHVRAVLLGEGVLIDPLGAVLSVVMLDVALSGFEPDPLIYVPTRLAGGALLGLAGAGAVRAVLFVNRRPPVTDMTLLLVGSGLATFVLAERVLHDSGLAAVAVMGLALAAMHVPHAEAVREFEDDLTRFLIGATYILATATVDVNTVLALWPGGVAVVLLLMFAVRPLVVFASAHRSDLHLRERLFIGLIGPRGVVSAAIAAFAARSLGTEGGGDTLSALVFLTIFLTVAVQSTYASPMSRWLRVRSMRALIAGAGQVGRRLGTRLQAGGFDVTLIDLDDTALERARLQGLAVAAGDATDVRTIQRLGGAEAQIAVGATDSDQVNLLFCQYLRSASPEVESFSRVHQPDALEAFKQAGVRAISESDAMAEAMMELIGSPELHGALSPSSGERMTLVVPIGSGLHGRRVRELRLPPRVLALLVQRGNDEIIPNGETVLRREDRMLIWGKSEAVREARAALAAIE